MHRTNTSQILDESLDYTRSHRQKTITINDLQKQIPKKKLNHKGRYDFLEKFTETLE